MDDSFFDFGAPRPPLDLVAIAAACDDLGKAVVALKDAPLVQFQQSMANVLRPLNTIARLLIGTAKAPGIEELRRQYLILDTAVNNVTLATPTRLAAAIRTLEQDLQALRDAGMRASLPGQ